jgi:hypothetical protein
MPSIGGLGMLRKESQSNLRRCHPRFSSSMDGVVIDTEGRVFEPLGRGDDQMWWGTSSYHASRLGKGLGRWRPAFSEAASRRQA